MDVFPIPPGPMRASEVRFSARPMVLSISSSRPKHARGGGGGGSPSMLDLNVRRCPARQLEWLTWFESRRP